MTSEVCAKADQRMFVEAAPVAVIARAPFVVSAETAIAHAGVLLNVVNAEFTRVVDAAVPSRRMMPSIFQDATDVPPAACCRATIKTENVKAELLDRTI